MGCKSNRRRTILDWYVTQYIFLNPSKCFDRAHSASADKTIRLWQKHKTIQVFKGHRDAVRGLTLVPDLGFASCSNDRYGQSYAKNNPLIRSHSEIRVWTMDGDVIYTLSGHSSFVYSLAVLPDLNIVSAGEDRSVRIWQGMWISSLAKTVVSDKQFR